MIKVFLIINMKLKSLQKWRWIILFKKWFIKLFELRNIILSSKIFEDEQFPMF